MYMHYLDNGQNVLRDEQLSFHRYRFTYQRDVS